MILSEYFYSGDILYIAQLFYDTCFYFPAMNIFMPPRRFSKTILPILFIIKFVGSIFSGFLTDPSYPSNFMIPFILSIIYYMTLYIYAALNYEEEKWKYISGFFLMNLGGAVIHLGIGFIYDTANVTDFICSAHGYSDAIVLFEFTLRQIINMVSFLLPIYLICPLIRRLYTPPKSVSIIISAFFVCLELPGFIVFIVEDFSMSGEFKYPTMFFVIIIPLAILYAILLTFVLNSNYKQREAFLNQQAKLQFDYYSSLEKNQQTIRKMNHDIKNHIQALKILSENNDTEGFKKYVSEMTSSYDVKKIEYCENNIVNAAVSSKEAMAREKGIIFEASINLPEKIDIDSMDIVSVFTNLLDNAIEECERIAEGEKKITLNCVCKKGTIAICCENSCLNEEKAKKLTTQKKDKFLHGLGTNIVRNIAEKYNGSYSANAENGIFSASVLMGCK